MKLVVVFTAVALVAFASAGHAEDPHMHHDHGAPAAAKSGSEVTEAYEAVNEKMHEAMDVELTGDADVDFVRGMIPHHQGAVDMANVVLKYGKDPEIRKLAEAVVKAQEEEITFMKAWLAKRGK
jgi:uncharacterized protein (DUF305 family)